MSTNESQKIQVTITVPQKFHTLLEKMAKSYDSSIEEYVLDQVICGLDLDLQEPAGTALGFGNETDYQDQLRAMVSGGAA